MLLRDVCVLLVITLTITSTSAQSIDEEEPVHVGASEGSGNVLPDDEDFEGSSLPPDTFYATTPQVRPKFSSSTTSSSTTTTTTKNDVHTTTVVRQRITTQPTSTPRATTLANPNQGDSRPPIPFAESSFFGTRAILFILGTILVLLTALILVIICCKSYNNRKQAYRPGKRQSPDALLED